MTRAHCPVCFSSGRDSLHEITPTGDALGRTGTARWWRVVLHSDKQGGICPGSGARV